MALTREKPPRWIPREIPNIDGRIEPLFRLEILFPALRREFPSRLFRSHDLDFLTEDISEALSITLSCIDDAHIQKPTDQMQFVRNALAKSDVHHPLVWKNLLDCDTVRKGLFDDPGNFLTDEMLHVLITYIYPPSNNPSVSSTCTLAHAAVEYFKPKLLQSLLSFFKEPRLDRDDLDATFFLATISYLKLQAAQLTLANNSTSSKDVRPRAAKNKKAKYPPTLLWKLAGRRFSRTYCLTSLLLYSPSLLHSMGRIQSTRSSFGPAVLTPLFAWLRL